VSVEDLARFFAQDTRELVLESLIEAKERGLASPTPEECKQWEIWALRLLARGNRAERHYAKKMAERMKK
jgi:hypothetical protein